MLEFPIYLGILKARLNKHANLLLMIVLKLNKLERGQIIIMQHDGITQ